MSALLNAVLRIDRTTSLRLLPWHRLVEFSPKLLALTLVGWRVKSLHPPQPPLSLINMELPIIASVSNMRLQRRLDPLGHGVVHLVLVRQRHCDVVDLQPDEGRAGVGNAANVRAVLWQFDEVDDDVEFGEGFSGSSCGISRSKRSTCETISSRAMRSLHLPT